ncbi:lactate utilisation protein LutB domain-containing protein, partial [Actinacidiphila sp. bgisy144]
QGGPVTLRGTRTTIKPAKGHAAERAAMRAGRWALDHPGAWRATRRMAGATRRLHPRRLPLPGPAKAWSDARDLPAVPTGSFRSWWQQRERQPRAEQPGAQQPRADQSRAEQPREPRPEHGAPRGKDERP